MLTPPSAVARRGADTLRRAVATQPVSSAGSLLGEATKRRRVGSGGGSLPPSRSCCARGLGSVTGRPRHAAVPGVLAAQPQLRRLADGAARLRGARRAAVVLGGRPPRLRRTPGGGRGVRPSRQRPGHRALQPPGQLRRRPARSRADGRARRHVPALRIRRPDGAGPRPRGGCRARSGRPERSVAAATSGSSFGAGRLLGL